MEPVYIAMFVNTFLCIIIIFCVGLCNDGKPIAIYIDNIRPMDWKLISATVINRVSRPLAKWLVVFGLHIYPS